MEFTDNALQELRGGVRAGSFIIPDIVNDEELADNAHKPVAFQRSDTRRIDDVTEAQIGGGGSLHVFTSDYNVYALPKRHLPKHSMPSSVVYQGITDLRQLDHNPRLNMASFVTTWMEPEAVKLIKESLNVNLVDLDEYPSCTDIHQRCVAILANLFNSPAVLDAENSGRPLGAGCIGSSEAIMLAGLAMKKKWQARRRAAGLPADKPNIVMSYSVQVCWEKFCVYFDVEEKYVPLEEDRYVLTAELAKPLIDENTIGVVGILGSTYNGEFEDMAALDDMVEEVNQANGWQVPIHVDGASGGFIAPFLYPDLQWDFRLKNVKSINASGHKYGLVYAGVGWVLWREPDDVPEDLVFHLNYLIGLLYPISESLELFHNDCTLQMDHSMTLVEKLIQNLHYVMATLNLAETNQQKYYEKLTTLLKPHRRQDNPHRQVKTTGQC